MTVHFNYKIKIECKISFSRFFVYSKIEFFVDYGNSKVQEI